MTQPKTSNISNATKALIIKTGHQLQIEYNIKHKLPIHQPSKVMPTRIRQEIGGNHYEIHDDLLKIKTVIHWWKNGRNKFEKGESLDVKAHSGRPKHGVFAT